MRVVNGLNSKNVLLDLLTGKEKVFHVSDMKPFVFVPTVVDPLDIARRDHMEYFIDKILDHRGNIKKRSTLEFHVSWLGYAQESNTWEPYQSLRNSEPLYTYLHEKNLLQTSKISLSNPLPESNLVSLVKRIFFHFYSHRWSVIGFRKFLVSRGLTSLYCYSPVSIVKSASFQLCRRLGFGREPSVVFNFLDFFSYVFTVFLATCRLLYFRHFEREGVM